MKKHAIFAALYDRLTKASEAKVIGPLRRELLDGVTGAVLDVGAGTGANLPHFLPEAAVTALEPDTHMLRRGRKKTSAAQVTWVEGSAEEIPFADESYDAAVATLVLCTVANPNRGLAEIRRVLRPGGRLIFLEHVASDHPGWRGVQSALNPLWGKISAECHLTRDTLSAIKKAGFQIERFETTTLMPILPVIYGWARKV